MKKLIIIRGNSGSGKSSLSVELRERALSPNRTALVEQDYLRRIVLKEKEAEGTNNIGLISQTVRFALERDYDVILEGILFSERYSAMLSELTKVADHNFIFYLDVSLEETLERHKKKHNAHEFGEKEMRGWYNKNDTLGFEGEIILPESNTMEDSINTILQVTKI